MIVNGKKVDVNQLTELQNKNFYRRTKKGIMLNDEQREVLTRHGINYEECINLQELLFQIEECMNEENMDFENLDLEKVSLELSEMYYYNYTNK